MSSPVQVDRRAKGRWLCRDLARNRRGPALIVTTVCLPVLVGFALLVTDASGTMNLHAHLQHAAAAPAGDRLSSAPDVRPA